MSKGSRNVPRGEYSSGYGRVRLVSAVRAGNVSAGAFSATGTVPYLAVTSATTRWRSLSGTATNAFSSWGASRLRSASEASRYSANRFSNRVAAMWSMEPKNGSGVVVVGPNVRWSPCHLAILLASAGLAAAGLAAAGLAAAGLAAAGLGAADVASGGLGRP